MKRVMGVVAVAWLTVAFNSAYAGLYGFGTGTQGWTALRVGGEITSMYLEGIGGANILVSYDDPEGEPSDAQCFVYNMESNKVIDIYNSGGPPVYPEGIDGNNVVGTGGMDPGNFLCPGLTVNQEKWIRFNYPDAHSTYAWDISGDNIAGGYVDDAGLHGFIYNYKENNWTSFDYPGARYTDALSISGNKIVGYYQDANGGHSFLYNNSEWITLNYPGARSTWAHGIDGNNIVGYYRDFSFNEHGFIYVENH